MKIIRASELWHRRAQAAFVARETGLNQDTAAARVASRVPPSPDYDTPRVAASQLFRPATYDELQPFTEVKPSYDLMAYLATRSAQAYSSPAEIEARIGCEDGCDWKLFRRWTDRGYGYRRGKTAVIVFRGTILWNLVQWVHTNLLAIPIGRPLRHLGFVLAWRRLRPQVLRWLEQTLPADGELMLTGHSLGGAMAIISAYELSDRFPIRAVATIGAPRVGLAGFRDAYLAKRCRTTAEGTEVVLGDVTRRVTHADDLVSRVPPSPLFRHVGQEYRLTRDGHLHTSKSRTTFERLLTAFDNGLGWIYQQIDTQQISLQAARPIPPPSAPSPLAQKILLPATVFASEKPKRPVIRFFSDLMKAQSLFPMFALLSLHVLQVIAIAVGAIIGAGVFLLGCLDLRAHQSALYTTAFGRRFRLPDIFRKLSPETRRMLDRIFRPTG